MTMDLNSIYDKKLDKEGISINLSTEDYLEFIEDLITDIKQSKDKDSISDLTIYLLALDKKIPVKWEPYLKEFKKNKDPEYLHYLKLKEKFEG